ncbi:MAG: Osmoregulated proline transporter OpuE [Phycisphaerae bacterium]|nr:Osmoregulated proline transporter OpuE [Phycisphaerae bacterium]
MGPTVIAFLVLYFAVVVAIGYWAMRKGAGKNLEGYLLGGRKVGPLVTAMTLQATSMSGYMFLGAGSAGYGTGYWSLWYASGDIGGGVVNLSIIGRRMRKLSKILGSLTSVEYLEHRYPGAATRLIAATLTIFFLFFYILAQFIAGAKGMAKVTGLGYEWSLLIAVAIILLYTYMGGYFAVAWTDFFQSIVMIIGMIWIFGACLHYLGGFTAANHALAALDPTYLSVWGKGLLNKGQWGEVAGAVLVFSVGYMGWPHVVTRHMAMTRPSTARLAGFYATLWNLFFVTSPYIIGIMAILIVPGLKDPEMAIFAAAGKLLPAAAVGIVMAAIMAAIMSTADSILLQVGSVASRDLYQRFFRRRASEREMVWVARLLVLGIGVAGYLVSVSEPPGVFTIVIFTTSVLGSAFLPAYVCAVWWRKANTPGAVASMVGGAATAIVWQLDWLGLRTLTALHPMFAGLIVSILLIVVVSLCTARVAPVPTHIREAMDETARLGPIPKEMLRSADASLAPQAAAIRQSL